MGTWTPDLDLIHWYHNITYMNTKMKELLSSVDVHVLPKYILHVLNKSEHHNLHEITKYTSLKKNTHTLTFKKCYDFINSEGIQYNLFDHSENRFSTPYIHV